MKPNYDDSFANLGRAIDALTPVFDRCIEEIFDAVDNTFRLRSAVISPLILSLLTAPVNAGDICDNLHQKDTLIIFNNPAARIDMDFDTTAHSICYSFTPMVKDMSVEPDHVCVGLEDEETQPIWLRFKDGKGYEISDIYNPEMTLQYYNFYMKACYDRGLKI